MTLPCLELMPFIKRILFCKCYRTLFNLLPLFFTLNCICSFTCRICLLYFLLLLKLSSKRFEEEILSTKAAEAEAAAAAAANGARNNSRKMIIGAGTFNQVQQQISSKGRNSPTIPPPRPLEEKPHVELPIAGNG